MVEITIIPKHYTYWNNNSPQEHMPDPKGLRYMLATNILKALVIYIKYEKQGTIRIHHLKCNVCVCEQTRTGPRMRM